MQSRVSVSLASASRQQETRDTVLRFCFSNQLNPLTVVLSVQNQACRCGPIHLLAPSKEQTCCRAETDKTPTKLDRVCIKRPADFVFVFQLNFRYFVTSASKGNPEFKNWARVFLPVANRPLTSSARARDIRVCVEKVSGLRRRTWCVCTLDQVNLSVVGGTRGIVTLNTLNFIVNWH